MGLVAVWFGVNWNCASNEIARGEQAGLLAPVDIANSLTLVERTIIADLSQGRLNVTADRKAGLAPAQTKRPTIATYLTPWPATSSLAG